MKELIAQHGIQATVAIVLVLFNVLLTAVQTGVNKLEDYLSGGDPTKIDPNSSLEKVKALTAKILGWTSSVIDWLTGNKAH